MKQLLFSTSQELAGFALRIVLGGIMLPHGAQKLLGWFGGFGYTSTMKFFTEDMRLPWIVAVFIIFVEFFGSLALMAGFASRLWAFALLIIMFGAIVTTNYKHGLFMNWFGNQTGEGFEYHVLVIGICIAILMIGSGRYSVDGLIIR